MRGRARVREEHAACRQTDRGTKAGFQRGSEMTKNPVQSVGVKATEIMFEPSTRL